VKVADYPAGYDHAPLPVDLHQRQEPFLVAHKNLHKTFHIVKHAIKLVGAANPIANSKFAEQYVTNNKANQYFKFNLPFS